MWHVSLLVAFAYLLMMPGRSFADPEKATVYLENQTGKRVTYQFKWGADAPWKDFDLQTGRHVVHRRSYDPKGVPQPYIRVAAAPGFEGPLYKPYKLFNGFDDKPQRYHFEIKQGKFELHRDRAR